MINKKYIKFSKPLFSNDEIKSVNKVLKSGWLTTGLVTKKDYNRIVNPKKMIYPA